MNAEQHALLEAQLASVIAPRERVLYRAWVAVSSLVLVALHGPLPRAGGGHTSARAFIDEMPVWLSSRRR